MLHEEVDLKWDEMEALVQDFQLLERLRADLVVGGTATFIGCRPRNREVLQRRMYRAEIGEWMKEADLTDKQATSSRRKADETEHLISSSDQIILCGGLMGHADSYQHAVPIN
jgi:two pore calcium channel protein 1